MNKDKFLVELREYLRILENQEQEDILEEYAQHIDMKMQKGLSEEEAIRDFGPMEELAAQILEAYHVKPEFQRRGSLLKLPKHNPGSGEGEESFLKRGVRWLRKTAMRVICSIRNGFLWLWRKCRAVMAWLARPFARRKITDDIELKTVWHEGKETAGMGKKFGGFFGRIGHGIAMLWRWIFGCCIFWLRVCWNMGWLLFSVFCGFMALTALMGIGGILVLLFQGYPLAGIFLISLGGLLCFGALAFWASSLRIRKKKDGRDEGPEEADGEVTYEQTA